MKHAYGASLFEIVLTLAVASITLSLLAFSLHQPIRDSFALYSYNKQRLQMELGLFEFEQALYSTQTIALKENQLVLAKDDPTIFVCKEQSLWKQESGLSEQLVLDNIDCHFSLDSDGLAQIVSVTVQGSSDPKPWSRHYYLHRGPDER